MATPDNSAFRPRLTFVGQLYVLCPTDFLIRSEKPGGSANLLDEAQRGKNRPPSTGINGRPHRLFCFNSTIQVSLLVFQPSKGVGAVG
ncbi:MAG: hypothetical protein ACE5NG_16685 [bacterium]